MAIGLKEILEIVDLAEALLPELDEMIKKYKPFIKDILKRGIDIFDEMTDNTRVCEIKARNSKAQYDAYINEGFTAEQAMLFLIKSDNGSYATSAYFANTLAKLISESGFGVN